MRSIPTFRDFAERIGRLATSGPTEKLQEFLFESSGDTRIYLRRSTG